MILIGLDLGPNEKKEPVFVAFDGLIRPQLLKDLNPTFSLNEMLLWVATNPARFRCMLAPAKKSENYDFSFLCVECS